MCNFGLQLISDFLILNAKVMKVFRFLVLHHPKLNIVITQKLLVKRY